MQESDVPAERPAGAAVGRTLRLAQLRVLGHALQLVRLDAANINLLI